MRLITGGELKDTVAAAVIGDTLSPGHTELDIRLGNIGWHEKSDVPISNRVHTLRKGAPLEHLQEVYLPDHGYGLKPLRYLRAETMETFQMPENVQGIMTLCSWAAQAGLEQSSSLTLKAGWAGTLILELFNSLTWHELLLIPGERIAQIQFFDIRNTEPQPPKRRLPFWVRSR